MSESDLYAGGPCTPAAASWAACGRGLGLHGREASAVYLPPAFSAIGTTLEVEAFGARFAAEVAPDVLYDPAGDRLRR